MTALFPVVSDIARAQSFAQANALLRAPANDAAIRIDDERDSDVAARERLLDAAFGAARFAKSSEALRAGRLPAAGLSLAAREGAEAIGTVRLWHVRIGDRPALMLGPLAVAASHRSLGVGAMLMREALWRAAQRGHKAIVLVGDAPYYARFGFEAALTKGLDWPGEVDRARLLGFEIEPGALTGATGRVEASGAKLLRRMKRTPAQERRAA
ncbi:MAG: N-acetyltransferase [Methylobacteriaceae bacterium]|nr:N-acetyltransferase [Methylobacteriaceae bacterium]